MGRGINGDVQALIDYLQIEFKLLADIDFGDKLAYIYDKWKDTHNDGDLPVKICVGSDEEKALTAAFQAGADKAGLPPIITEDILPDFLTKFNHSPATDLPLLQSAFLAVHGKPPVSSGTVLMREAHCLAVIELVEPS